MSGDVEAQNLGQSLVALSQVYKHGMKLLTGLAIIFALMGGTHSQSPTTFCDLLRNPTKYNGHKVNVRVTYRYAFEMSDLYCLGCMDQGKAWLDMTVDLEETSRKALKKMPGAGIVNLTVEGTFVSGGTFGHLNGYRYEIQPDKISNVVVLQKGMKSHEKEERIEKRWACGGANPK